MKKRLLLAALMALAGRASASKVDVLANDTSVFSYKATANNFSDLTLKAAVQNGTELLDGTKLYIGTFTTTDLDLKNHVGDVAYLFSKFTEYGNVSIGDGEVAPNKVAGGVKGSITNAASPLAGQQIYYFVVAATDYSTAAARNSSAFQIGIFYESKSTLSSWAFPTGDLGTTVVDIADLTQNGDGLQLASGANLVLGSFGPDHSNAETTAINFTLVSVPEPATGALLGLGGAAMLGLRRRRG